MSPSIFSPVASPASTPRYVYRVTDLGADAAAIAKFLSPQFAIICLFSLCECGATLADALAMGVHRVLEDGTRDLSFDTYYTDKVVPNADKLVAQLVDCQHLR